jgi:hypothetical protein
MRRRNFLKLAGFGTAALALPAFVAYSASIEHAMAGIIINELHFLKLNREGVNQFVADHCKLSDDLKQATMKMKVKAYYFLKVDAERSKFVRTLTDKYLISTDFFRNRMDESKEVNYVGLYNPHKTPCSNPFSAIYYPQIVS